MVRPFSLGCDRLTAELLVGLGAKPKPALIVSAEAESRAQRFRDVVDHCLASESVLYGVNTGFGYLADVRIDREKLGRLQLNLIRSHACGVGDSMPLAMVRALLVLRAHTFLLGPSGVSLGCIFKLVEFIEHDLLPLIPMEGSVGASGDLAPLAHLALGLIGEGEIVYQGERLPAAEALARAGVSPLVPLAKEGLSLINGTLFTAVLAAHGLCEAIHLAQAADVAAALSLEGLRGTLVAFDSRIQQVRGQSGQSLVAGNLRLLLDGPDPLRDSHRNCGKVQDPYSFRCAPQVHGASRDTLEYTQEKLTFELNCVSDNPLVFESGEILSGGNFHAQPIALPLDFMAIAMAEFGSIAERRIEKLTNPQHSGLPPFVTNESGLRSGFMIPHVVAAALASENKIYAHPASVDSIPTSADKEDHVSMGPIAARKLFKVNSNVARILAIELLTACQAIDLLAPLTPAPALTRVYERVRELSPFRDEDCSLSADIERVALAVRQGEVGRWVREYGVKLV